MESTVEYISPSGHSALLNLTKISNSQAEMSYITRMRNMILFQLSSSEELEYFQQRLYLQFWIHNRSLPIFRICYSHAFFQVVKSRVLVHNYEPFRHWDVTVIGNDGHVQTIKGRKIVIYTEENIESPSVDKFLVADNGLSCPSFPNWNFYPCYKEVITHIQTDVFEQFYADSFRLRHESIWRRVYDAKATYFFCEYNDFSLYVIEQKRDKTPINVFKTILKRETGFCFNQESVLKTIASPYYCILPHQDERMYAKFLSCGFHSTMAASGLTILDLSCRLEISV